MLISPHVLTGSQICGELPGLCCGGHPSEGQVGLLPHTAPALFCPEQTLPAVAQLSSCGCRLAVRLACLPAPLLSCVPGWRPADAATTSTAAASPGSSPGTAAHASWRSRASTNSRSVAVGQHWAHRGSARPLGSIGLIVTLQGHFWTAFCQAGGRGALLPLPPVSPQA